ncbi:MULTISPECIES: tryptophan-rich sensory protein [Deinococcus]|uniref:Tryptophan-rich sensory protein n=1 Tax=Deinococcus rufus TaxID=2136097 RepID=A0ABV7ZD52_9DEIO|nr:tryptophan-rich sensory protein [Deinococcus sp. AB2017081]WQE93905.1 tryptophan-rich sensory protein [Deinococcus sp. AB2017081]
MSGLPRQLILLAATLLTLVMNYLSNALPLFGNSNKEVSDALPNAFTPAGLTFAVWGPIFLGLTVFAVYQALPAQRGPRLDRLFWPFLLGNLLNVGWLLAFQSLRYGLSVVIMLTLLASLIWLYVTVRDLPPRGAEVWTLQLPASLYVAWISVATMANITAYLVSAGVTQGALGLTPATWSAVLVVIAALLGAFFLWRFRDVAVALVLVWAFLGVYLARPEVLTVTVGVGLGVLALLVAGALALRTRPAAL